ncbi:MAG: PilZ domain-containing protein [Acidobacteriia bacterium]|nr:PilZ domain-containing protein [Terriglobia bacterium]
MNNSRGPGDTRVPKEGGGLLEYVNPADVNQRSHPRYPLDLEVGYAISRGRRSAIAGHGRAIDLSSSGVRFIADAPLPTSLPITVSIMWPRLVASGVGLQLVATGKIVRTREVETAVQITRYEFRMRVGPVTDLQ